VNTTFGLDGQNRPRPPRILASILLLIGLLLAVGGIRLATLGGSLYYLIAGVALIAAAVMLWRGQRWGAYLYGLVTVGTILWAIMESGFDGWALAPRVLPFLVLGLLLLRPKVRRALGMSVARPVLASPMSWIAIVALVAICIAIGMRQPYATLPFAASAGKSDIAARDWQHWGGNAAGTRYAPFDQINASNVGKLQIAWTYRTGVGGAFKATPLQIGDTLYVCLARNIISALDADTGTERWRFDPELKDSKVGFTTTCRGVTYFKAPEPAAACPERILTATTDARLIAIDAKTGQRCSDFGTNGEVTLLNGMGDVKPGFYY
jgi:glucose dehydrogenase